MVSKADFRACGVMPMVLIICQISKDLHQKGSCKTTQAQLLRMQQLPLTRRVPEARCQTLLIPSKQQPLLCAIATWIFSCQIIHTLSGMYSSFLEFCCELVQAHRHKHRTNTVDAQAKLFHTCQNAQTMLWHATGLASHQ